MIIYTAVTPHHAFPLGSSPFSSCWCPDGTVQTWSTTTHPAQWCTFKSYSETHCRQGWEIHREGKTTGFFVLLGSVAVTPPSLLIIYLKACLPSLKVWCSGVPSYQRQVFPLRELVQWGKRVKRRQIQTKHESMHSYSLGTHCLFSLKGFLRSCPPCPFPLPTDP